MPKPVLKNNDLIKIINENIKLTSELDKQIVINSMMLKWHNVQLDFKKKTDEFEEV